MLAAGGGPNPSWWMRDYQFSTSSRTKNFVPQTGQQAFSPSSRIKHLQGESKSTLLRLTQTCVSLPITEQVSTGRCNGIDTRFLEAGPTMPGWKACIHPSYGVLRRLRGRLYIRCSEWRAGTSRDGRLHARYQIITGFGGVCRCLTGQVVLHK